VNSGLRTKRIIRVFCFLKDTLTYSIVAYAYPRAMNGIVTLFLSKTVTPLQSMPQRRAEALRICLVLHGKTPVQSLSAFVPCHQYCFCFTRILNGFCHQDIKRLRVGWNCNWTESLYDRRFKLTSADVCRDVKRADA